MNQMRIMMAAALAGAAAFLLIAAVAGVVGAGMWWWPLLAGALVGGAVRAADGAGLRAVIVAIAATYLATCVASIPSIVRALYANPPGGPPLSLVSLILSWIATTGVIAFTAIIAPIARAIESPMHAVLLVAGLLVAASVVWTREPAGVARSSGA